MSPTPLLVATGVSKSFAGVALAGDDGAGKSTLTKAIAGVQPGASERQPVPA